MATVTVHEAKTHLSRLIAEAMAGDEVVIARGKQPMVRLVPVNAPPPAKRELGWLRDDARGSDPLAYGFWDPLPPDELALWNFEGEEPDDAPAA